MTSRQFTPAALRAILREAAGLEEGTPADGALDVSFQDLGLESLALLETGGRIEREYGITLDDGALLEAATPRELLDLVNAHLAATAA
ncbi:acyl carrier protein [Streptomyces phyllanthi]|uniref:Acyl carrier protein n=1 Tax=Streptomyces phyllanthi TaxID=1803180 RepID=A0A5N8WCX4_9ACTN|nr:acyl carrier protein [Streptomyces phyllanthi]MPY45321.1 acyl carrier protein [Streptomyces phyllanthi]